RVTEDPDRRPGRVVELDDEVLAAGDDDAVVTRVVGRGVDMEPVDTGAHEERRVVAGSRHVRREQIADLPAPEQGPGGADLGDRGVDLALQVELGEETDLAGIDVVSEVEHARVVEL